MTQKLPSAVVTGASRGIGRGIATALAQAGCDLLLVARTKATLAETAAAITATTGRTVHTQAADLSTHNGVAIAAATAQALFPQLNALVNNAGATQRGDLLTLPDAAWEDGFALKFFGAARLTRALWPNLATVRGSVLFIAGAAGRTPTADFVVGSAVNAAVMALTKSLAQQGATEGIRVNCINPGLVKTDRLQSRIDDLVRREHLSQSEAEQALARAWGVTRIGQPEEIAALAEFLTVGKGTYCQGAIIEADGGATRGM